jgi:hypothetical protein
MRENEFRALFDGVSTWGRWPDRPERGALNELTPERVVEAARLVRSGVTVTLSLPLDTEARIDNPEPADHRMTMLPDVDIGSGSVRFAKTRATATSTPSPMWPSRGSSTTGHRRSV